MQRPWRTELHFREPEAEVLGKSDAFWPADFGFRPSKKYLGPSTESRCFRGNSLWFSVGLETCILMSSQGSHCDKQQSSLISPRGVLYGWS